MVIVCGGYYYLSGQQFRVEQTCRGFFPAFHLICYSNTRQFKVSLVQITPCHYLREMGRDSRGESSFSRCESRGGSHMYNDSIKMLYCTYFRTIGPDGSVAISLGNRLVGPGRYCVRISVPAPPKSRYLNTQWVVYNTLFSLINNKQNILTHCFRHTAQIVEVCAQNSVLEPNMDIGTKISINKPPFFIFFFNT